MATREVRAPEAVTAPEDGEALMCHVEAVAGIVARYTRYSELDVLVVVMRVVGHMCALGGDAE